MKRKMASGTAQPINVATPAGQDRLWRVNLQVLYNKSQSDRIMRLCKAMEDAGQPPPTTDMRLSRSALGGVFSCQQCPPGRDLFTWNTALAHIWTEHDQVDFIADENKPSPETS